MWLLDGAANFGVYAGVPLVCLETALPAKFEAGTPMIAQVLGLPAEQRKFVPHVSLARLKEPDLHGLHRFVASHNLYRSRMFEVDRFVLFSSRPTRGGGPYAVEESYDLQAAQ